MLDSLKLVYFFTIGSVQIFRARKREGLWAQSYLRTLEEGEAEQLDAATFTKIWKSYAMHNSMIGNAFTQLHGRKTTAAEKERFLHFFICYSVYDKFFDEKLLNEEELRAILFFPKEFIPKTFEERLFLKSHNFLLEQTMNDTGYKKIMEAIYVAQVDSLQQFNASTTHEQLADITFRKGGNSLLMGRHYLDMDASEAEDKCWYLIGTLIQLGNDIFDIHKDMSEGIHTLPNRAKDIGGLENIFLEKVRLMNEAIDELPVTHNRKLRFRVNMATIYALGLTGIKQLKVLQGKRSNLPDFNTLPRKALIVDMEKPGNMLAALGFTYQYAHK